jgi:hypothetical protein
MSTALGSESDTTRRYTADDLLHMPEGDHFEIVDGRLLEHVMGAQAAFLAGEMFGSLHEHVKQFRLGWVFLGVSYDCFGDDIVMCCAPMSPSLSGDDYLMKRCRSVSSPSRPIWWWK